MPPRTFGVHVLVAGGRRGVRSPSPVSIWATPASSPGDFSPASFPALESVDLRGQGTPLPCAGWMHARDVCSSTEITRTWRPGAEVDCCGAENLSPNRSSAPNPWIAVDQPRQLGNVSPNSPYRPRWVKGNNTNNSDLAEVDPCDPTTTSKPEASMQSLNQLPVVTDLADARSA
jgi:hypothetical protein